MKSLVEKFFSKSYLLFTLATLSLSAGTYFSTQNINKYLVDNFNAQNKSRYLLKVQSNFSRSATIYSFGILFQDKELISSADKLYFATKESFKEKSQQLGNFDILFSLFNDFEKELKKTKLSLDQQKSVVNAFTLLQRIELIEKKFEELEQQQYGIMLASNEKLIQKQKSVKTLLSSFHWTLTILLYVLAFFNHKKEALSKEIEKSEELHRMLLSSLAEGIIFCNEEGKVITCNQSAETILGIRKKRIVGLPISEVFRNAKDRENEPYNRSTSPFYKAIKHGEVCSRELMRFGKGGFTQLWLSLNSQPLFKDSMTKSFSTLFSFTDITEQIEQERTIKKQQADLIYSSKMRALGQMAGGIAHEINNPLAIIKAEAEDIIDIADEEGSLDSATAVDAAEKITLTTNRIANIIKGLKIFSRNDKNDNAEAILLKEVFEDVISLCEDRAKRKAIKLDLTIEDPDFKILGQPTQIYQVFVNLINNAFDAIESANEKWVKIDIKREHKQVVIRVIDSGPGIPVIERDKIFQPFYSTKEVGKGTGLGLSISKGIIESHHGLFYIDGNYKNTCFAAKIPLLIEDKKEKDLEVA